MGSKQLVRKQPTTAAMQLLGGADGRGCAVIQNVGAVDCYIGPGSDLTTLTGILLAAGRIAVCRGDDDSWYGITASGTADLRILSIDAGQGVPGHEDFEMFLANSGGISNSAANTHLMQSNGANAVDAPFAILTVAITPNTTTTTETAGTLAMTTHATGRGTVFVSDGSKWQLPATANELVVTLGEKTIATTGNTDAYAIAPEAGTLDSIDFSGIDVLAASDTNYVTFSVTNLGQAGAGSTAMLAAADANTTKATGGTALAANTKRSLTMHGTPANLVVAKGDRLRIRYAATGTLANTVTGSLAVLRFSRVS